MISYNTLGGDSDTVVLGKGVDAAHWSAHLDTIHTKLTITYKP